MLPTRHRLRTRADFASVLRSRRGVRAGSDLLVVHATMTDARAGQPPRVGFVVSKAVGNSVIRHRTTRRLRALVGSELVGIPDGTDLVVRALPPAGEATSAQLAERLRPQLATVLARIGRRA